MRQSRSHGARTRARSRTTRAVPSRATQANEDAAQDSHAEPSEEEAPNAQVQLRASQIRALAQASAILGSPVCCNGSLEARRAAADAARSASRIRRGESGARRGETSNDFSVICADRRADDPRGEYPVHRPLRAADRATPTLWGFGRGAPAWRSTQRVSRDGDRPARDGPVRSVPALSNAMTHPQQQRACRARVGASNARVQLQATK